MLQGISKEPGWETEKKIAEKRCRTHTKDWRRKQMTAN